MHVVSDLGEIPPPWRGAAVALGNFDGVHRGHAVVIAATAEAARRLGAPVAALTFEPHPRELFRPDDPPFRLTLAEAKRDALAALGVEVLVSVPFDHAFSRIPAEAFVRDILVQRLGARHVACGPNFHFGHRRGGTPALLEALGAELGFGVTVVEKAVGEGGLPLSSTAVREALAAGDVPRANAILGRPWEIRGVVQRGAALGRTLGFPTANIPLGRHLAPRFGVYAVRAGVEDEAGGVTWFDGAASVGLRPTVNPLPEPLLEVFLFDFAGDLYGRRLRVAFAAFLREEAKFASLEALAAQMRADCDAARSLLAPV
ncbi:bifunctional riboflavin kinase/FAD synthetase [Elioraea tepida]|uniref:Riboflavin biosynthesis protein n=1 Tax=Elioraea tepida TaxID=2843330 RepID=A0A975U033_9PROT|nr:bifunctional riboflavin kinase/FAD synthetase [Elioraea tepida]QXM23352.1 bifunctional riboflavin kinase/FAD synthetase [Elioraea tepida]